MRKISTIGFIFAITIAGTMLYYITLKSHSSYTSSPITGGHQLTVKQITQQKMDSPLFSEKSNVLDKEVPVLPAHEYSNVRSKGIHQTMTNTAPLEIRLSHATKETEEQNDNSNMKEIDQKMALEIARSAIGKTKYSDNLPIIVKNEDREYCVIFPVDKKVPASTRYRGSDFAAEVRINKKTAKVVQVRLSE